MKTKILSYVSALSMLFVVAGCHDPETVVPNGDPKGILSIKAAMVGDDSSENSFNAEIDYDNNSIVVVFPYNYPRSSDELFTTDMMKDVKLTASLATNTKIEPALSTLDLSQTNYITVTNALGEKKRYSLKGEIRYNNECEVEALDLENGMSAVVYENEHKIMLITPNMEERIEPQTASLGLSYHATVIPDITKEPFDFMAEGAKITIIAQDGTSSQEYTFTRGVPEKLRYGIRAGSARVMWIKKLSELGIAPQGGGDGDNDPPSPTAGLGITDDYVVINVEGNMDAIVLDARNGSDTGKRLHMGNLPLGYNHSMTSDDAGNILVNSNHNQGMFTIWKFENLDDHGTKFFSGNIYGVGARVSVIGDVNGNARFGSPSNGTSLDIYTWGVENGKVKDYYDLVKLTGLKSIPWTSADWAPTNINDVSANCFAVYAGGETNGNYGPVLFSENGTTGPDAKGNKTYTFNAVAYGLPNCAEKDLNDPTKGPKDSENWVMNACDYKEFNNSKYFFYNSVNHHSWGGTKNDFMYLMDVTGGDLQTHAVDFSEKGLDLDHKCGAQAAGNLGSVGPSNDMRLWVDPSGFYMYAYFMYSNGYIGCVRVDCIKK